MRESRRPKQKMPRGCTSPVRVWIMKVRQTSWTRAGLDPWAVEARNCKTAGFLLKFRDARMSRLKSRTDHLSQCVWKDTFLTSMPLG